MNHRVKLYVTMAVLAFALISQVAFAGKEPGTFTPEGKGYFYYIHDLTKGDGQSNEFDLSRMYIGAKYQIADKFVARWISDIAHESGGGKFEIFAKYAYLDWDLGQHGAHLLMGLQGTNNWSAPEKAWGYRAIRYSPMETFGKFWGIVDGIYEARLEDWVDSLLDGTPTQAEIDKAAEVQNQIDNFSTGSATKMGSSADMGIGLKLKPTDKSYVNVMMRNGPGYKKAENNIYKNLQIRGGYYFLEKALHISAYAEVEPWKGVDNSGNSKRYMNFQWDAMANYAQKGVYSIGVNVNSKKFAGDFENITALCISGFGNVYVVKEKLKALARFDMYKSGFNDAELQTGVSTPETNGNLIIAGLDYMPAKKVHIIPNIQIMSFEDGDVNTVNEFYIHVWFKL